MEQVNISFESFESFARKEYAASQMMKEMVQSTLEQAERQVAFSKLGPSPISRQLNCPAYFAEVSGTDETPN